MPRKETSAPSFSDLFWERRIDQDDGKNGVLGSGWFIHRHKYSFPMHAKSTKKVHYWPLERMSKSRLNPKVLETRENWYCCVRVKGSCHQVFGLDCPKWSFRFFTQRQKNELFPFSTRILCCCRFWAWIWHFWGIMEGKEIKMTVQVSSSSSTISFSRF